MSDQKFHYYLFAGEINFARITNDESMRSKTSHGTKKANCITRITGENQVNRPQIAMAQYVMHKQFMDSVAKETDASYVVGEIFIHGFSYMGYMTEEESSPPMPTTTEDAARILQQ